MEDSAVVNSFRQHLKEKRIAEQVERDLELARSHKDHYRIDKLREDKDSVLKELSVPACRTFFEKTSLLTNSKLYNIY